MINYFEKFFARSYWFYVKYESPSSSQTHAIYILALLQTFNVMSIGLYIVSGIRGINYAFNVLYLLATYVGLASINFIWFYRVRGVNKVIEKYNTKEARKPFINPWIYIIFSILFFFSVKVFGFWPTGGLINNPLQHR